MTPPLHLCPLLDSTEAAAAEEITSKARYFRADELVTSAAAATRQGFYHGPDDRAVSLEAQIQAALAAKQSIPPEQELPTPPRDRFPETRVQVTDESTLKAAPPLRSRQAPARPELFPWSRSRREDWRMDWTNSLRLQRTRRGPRK